MRGIYFLVLLFVWGVVCEKAKAQAWTQPKGEAYFKLAQGRTAAAEQYAFDGEVKPYSEAVQGNAFFDRSLYWYAEYGLTDRHTLVALLPYKRMTVDDGEAKHDVAGIGSVMIGVRRKLKIAQPSALATTLMLTLPTGYTRNLAPAVGAGQVDAQLSLHYGLSLHPTPAYAQFGLGFRYRSAWYALSQSIACPPRDETCVEDTRPDFDNEWFFTGEVGVSGGRWVLFQLLGQGLWSNQPPELGFDPANPLPTRQRFLKTGLGLTLYPIRTVGFSVQYFTTPFGRNTLRSEDWFVGVEYRLF